MAVGGLSVFFDPFFVTTFVAVRRAMRDLQRVKEAEAAGEWSPAHLRARTEAIWGMMLALGRWFAIALALAAIVLAVSVQTPPERMHVDAHETTRYELDELAELYAEGPNGHPGELVRTHLRQALMDPRQPQVQGALDKVASAEPVLQEDLLRFLADRCETSSFHEPALNFSRLVDAYSGLNTRQFAVGMVSSCEQTGVAITLLAIEQDLPDRDEALVIRLQQAAGIVEGEPDLYQPGDHGLTHRDLGLELP